MRIAISLGASFLGYATHAGFLAGLHEQGIRPVAVAGSSAGAIAAGFYAAGLSQEQIRREVLRFDLRWSFVKSTLFTLHPLLSLGFSRHPSVFNSNGAVTYFESVLGQRRIEDLASPQLVVALTELDTHRAHFARSGPLARAMAASCCVPVMFSPIEFEGKLCHDGGVAHEMPMDFWFEDSEVDLIIAHRITHPASARSRFFPANIIQISGASHETCCRDLIQYRQQLAASHGRRLIIADTVQERPPLLLKRDLSGCYDLGMRQAQTFYEQTLRPLLDA